MDYLRIEDVSKSYSNHQALKNVSMVIPSQTIFGLLGPNGAGKTTLIRIVNQIIDMDSGTIHIKDQKLNPNHIRVIGYLPEERGLYQKMKVGEQLIYLGQLRGLTKRDVIVKGKEWCKRLDILDWWNKKVEDLSKGMAQKIQFIATVMHEPELIILDEPFSGFDPINANLIKDEILALRERGSTVIFSTHRMESVEQLCDHIALINESEKVLDGPKREIKKNFRDNTFIVHTEDEIQSLNEAAIMDQEKTEEGYRSTLRLATSRKPNDLLKELIGKTEVHHFEEKIPSINEIFISQVTKS